MIATDASAADPLTIVVADAPVAAATVGADSGMRNVAGKNVKAHAKLLNSKNRVRRLRAVHSLNAAGQSAGSALLDALGHDDPAVRYLAATGLGRIGGDSLRNAKTTLAEMAKPGEADQRAPGKLLSVRLAAAYAMCAAGEAESHLTILIEGVLYPERGISCSASDLIAQLGPLANAATETLETVHAKNKPGVKGGDYHIGGAAMNALRKIRGE